MKKVFFLLLLLSSSVEADTAGSFNKFFTTQWGPTQFNSAGAPDGYSDCGPTSLLMGAAYFGLMAPPTPETAESEIRKVRDLTRGQPTSYSGPTYSPMMILQGAQALGATIVRIAANSANVVSALEKGELVLMAGDPRTSWGYQLYTQGNYLHHYGTPGQIPPPTNGVEDVDHFGHWVIAFGVSPTGQIYVGDPLSTIGTIEVTGAAVDQYFTEWPVKTDALVISAY
jgi:hypothetical protein